MKGFEPFAAGTRPTSTPSTTRRTATSSSTATKEGEEPWTWVRTQGKGRVFYTAWGHDERTWGNPGFQDLVERGIRWAANKGDVNDSRPRVATGLKPFEYEAAEIPLYTARRAGGARGRADQQDADAAGARASRMQAHGHARRASR